MDAELPPCPEWLQGAARQHWGEVGAMLDGLGIMGRPHTLALALLCDALADWIAAMAASATDPLAIDVKPKAWERVLKGCREFGMTPAAITAVKSVPKPDAPNKPVMKYKLA